MLVLLGLAWEKRLLLFVAHAKFFFKFNVFFFFFFFFHSFHIQRHREKFEFY